MPSHEVVARLELEDVGCDRLAPSPTQPPASVPFGLFSLWDFMDQFPLRSLESIAVLQTTIQQWLTFEAAHPPVSPTRPLNALALATTAPSTGSRAHVPAQSKSISAAGNVTTMMRDLCEQLGLVQSLKSLRNFSPRTDRELAFAYNMVMNELDEYLFLFIRPDRRPYWSNKNWIPTSVRDNFHSATVELEAAGSSYACALGTASVFHSMRAAEHGLRALARERKIKLPKKPIEWGTWEDLIGKIRSESQALANRFPVGEKRDGVRSFYSGALGQFDGFRDEFRNSVMHVRGSYSEQKAIEVLRRVAGFMEHLSGKTNEDGKRIKWK